ncbi:motility associated factor glycosyltransferase family protein [Campylobacter jejuni]|nr:motility associated factor glycosyltransferase family protein [Campylobacter jejuni]MBT0860116.1 motility associated factor glycosyltransferase family protein [Campylobacter coli]
MIFTSNQQEIFKQNINALDDEILRKKLQEIKSTKFELLLGKDNLDINLRNTKDNTFLYTNTVDELNSMLEIYNDKYLLYPVLYFYGFGNGILFKALLQNKHHQHIVIFEKDIEILWIMFHILNFSQELKNSSLLILETDSLTMEFFSGFCASKPFFDFSRVYFLELVSNYYERYQEDILGLNEKIMQYFKNTIASRGNDPLDALQGIEQFVYNLPEMITHPTYKELLNKRKNLSKTAIIVSTGPSLTKQLPLLKKYQNKATIFCADSSYPILAKHNIKPDYVCMLERTELTAEFFNHDFGDFDKDIIFLCAGVVHPKVFEYLKGKNWIITQKFLAFPFYLNIEEFSYAAIGSSVAHMLSYLAIYLNHKNIILIGQDLAYAENGNSHPSEYQNSATYESQMYKHVLTAAYGGKKKVKTHFIWLLFKHYFENEIIPNAKKLNISIYNCTEGGARIQGALEKPFLWACKNLLSKDLDKPFKKLYPLSKDKQNKLMLKAYYKIYKSIKHCEVFKKESKEDFENIQKYYILGDSDKKYLNLAIKEIDLFKTKLENLKNMLDLYEILGPLLAQFELNLARIFVLNPKTPEDSFNKSVLWIKEHLELIHMIQGHIEAQENVLFKNIISLEEELKKRQLDKYLIRIKNANK